MHATALRGAGASAPLLLDVERRIQETEAALRAVAEQPGDRAWCACAGLGVTLEDAGHVTYSVGFHVVEVRGGEGSQLGGALAPVQLKSHTVHARFSEFYELRETLVEEWPEIAQLAFPRRVLWGSSSDDVRAERMVGLGAWLDAVLQLRGARAAPPLRSFLEVHLAQPLPELQAAAAAAPPAAAAGVEPEPGAVPQPGASKFVAPTNSMKMGKPVAAAHGLQVLMGVDSAHLAAILTGGVEAIKREFQTRGRAEDKENLRKTLSASWGDGRTLEQLAAHPNARTAKLQPEHVLALRMYSTSSYACVNDPLRKEPPERPHPFAATTYWINEGIRLLKAVAAQRDDAHTARTLWRGMKDLGLTLDFLQHGGTEFACMSTTASLQVAVGFAASKCPLIFKFETKDFVSRGADISFLSVYPDEKETLFPPLTFVRTINTRRETLGGVDTLVATVEPVQC